MTHAETHTCTPITPTHVDIEHDAPLSIASVLTLVTAPPLMTYGVHGSHGMQHASTPLIATDIGSDTGTRTDTSTSPASITTLKIRIDTMKASIQTECQTIRTSGSVTAAALSILMLYLWDGEHGRRCVVATAGAFYLASILPALWIPETRVITSYFGLAANSHIEHRLAHHSRCHFLTAKLIAIVSLLRLYIIPAIFLFVYSAMPTSEDAYATYLYDEFKQFMDWQQGLYNFVGLMGAWCGYCIYW